MRGVLVPGFFAGQKRKALSYELQGEDSVNRLVSKAQDRLLYKYVFAEKKVKHKTHYRTILKRELNSHTFLLVTSLC